MTNQKDEEESKLDGKVEKNDHKPSKAASQMDEDETNSRLSDSEFVTLMMTTRGTSPTPPASSSYVRSRRAEIGIVHQKEVTRPRKLPDSTDGETQCDRMEETSRYSRYCGGNRVPWSTYLDKYSSSSNSSVYSSRGFANASSTGSKLNSFAYTRTSEAATRNESAVKESNSSQETGKKEKMFDGLNCTKTADDSSASNDSKTSSRNQDDQRKNNKSNETKVRDGEQCSCGARKTETSESSSNTRISNRDLAFHRKEDLAASDSREDKSGRENQNNKQSPATKCYEYNQKRSSISLKCASKSEIPKCSSRTESTPSKFEAYCERRGSLSKSDGNFSPRTEESLRIVEGHCQDQDEEVISLKRNSSQRKDSASRYVKLVYFCT